MEECGKKPARGRASTHDTNRGDSSLRSGPLGYGQHDRDDALERLNAEIKRRTNVAGILPNHASITRLVGAMMLEQNDEWSLNRRYMQLEGLQTVSDTVPTRLSAVAR